jgi:hypothetical protein
MSSGLVATPDRTRFTNDPLRSPGISGPSGGARAPVAFCGDARWTKKNLSPSPQNGRPWRGSWSTTADCSAESFVACPRRTRGGAWCLRRPPCSAWSATQRPWSATDSSITCAASRARRSPGTPAATPRAGTSEPTRPSPASSPSSTAPARLPDRSPRASRWTRPCARPAGLGVTALDLRAHHQGPRPSRRTRRHHPGADRRRDRRLATGTSFPGVDVCGGP